MAFLIDTNIAIHARDGTDAVLDGLAEHDGAILLSSLSLAELQRGVFKDQAFTAVRQARLEVIALHTRTAVRCGCGTCLRADHSPVRLGKRT